MTNQDTKRSYEQSSSGLDEILADFADQCVADLETGNYDYAKDKWNHNVAKAKARILALYERED